VKSKLAYPEALVLVDSDDDCTEPTQKAVTVQARQATGFDLQ